MPIIPNSACTMPTEILHFPEAIARFPASKVVLNLRVSERSQIKNESILGQYNFSLNEVRRMKARLKAVVGLDVPEYGQLTEPRPNLLHAIYLCREFNAGLVAVDLSRLIRSKAFHNRTNRWADPTPDEIQDLLAMMRGVPFVATILDPSLTLRKLHILAVERGMAEKGNCGGRKPVIDYESGREILNDHSNGLRLCEILKKHGFAKTTVASFIKKKGGQPD